MCDECVNCAEEIDDRNAIVSHSCRDCRMPMCERCAHDSPMCDDCIEEKTGSGRYVAYRPNMRAAGY